MNMVATDTTFEPDRPLKKPLILLVEADPDSSDFLKYFFELKQYEVLVVKEVAHALAQIKVTHPDLLLVDIHPSTADEETLQKLQDVSQGHNIPVVLTSCDARPSFQEQVKMAGYKELFVKPIEIEQLEHTVTCYLQG